MAFIAINQLFGEVDLTAIDTAGPGYQNLVAGTGSGRMNFYLQTVEGYDPNLGGGEFQYMRFSGTIAAGTACEVTPSISGGIVISNATAWAGTAVSGRPLAYAVSSGTVGQFGWFQVQGNAIATVSGAPAAGNPVYWQAAGVVSPTGVASKQMVNAVFATAVSQTIGQGSTAVVLSATQAIVQINRPFAQGAIT
jgi:hypothetical protein